MADDPLAQDDLDNVLIEGYGAAREGADLTSCPYTLASAEAIEWMLGHWVWQMENANITIERAE